LLPGTKPRTKHPEPDRLIRSCHYSPVEHWLTEGLHRYDMRLRLDDEQRSRITQTFADLPRKLELMTSYATRRIDQEVYPAVAPRERLPAIRMR
jgi:hypothetical protein